jgi:hypothetical protein
MNNEEQSEVARLMGITPQEKSSAEIEKLAEIKRKLETLTEKIKGIVANTSPSPDHMSVIEERMDAVRAVNKAREEMTRAKDRG